MATASTSPAAGSATEAALARVQGLLAGDPAAALAGAREILASTAHEPRATLLAGQALCALGRAAEAVPLLAALAGRHAHVPAATWELAQAAIAADDRTTAIAALERLTQRWPAVASGWFALAGQYRAAGRTDDGWRADLSGVGAAGHDPELIRAAMAMNDGQLDTAAALLNARLARSPIDPPAVRLLGEVAWRQGDMAAAITHVERALEQAPGHDLAREFLIRLLVATNRLAEALAHAEHLAGSPAANPGHDLIRASVLVRLGEQARAGELYRRLLAAAPDQPLVWQNLGHVEKTLGNQAAAVAAYREATRRQPTLGEAWWSLANLKTVKLGGDDIAAMTAAAASLERTDRAEDRFHLDFALGKAHEDRGNIDAAFAHYAAGNRRRRAMIAHDADAFSAEIAAAIAALAVVAQAGDGGCMADDPIFIVGLPRSGSTLIEQILASHSAVEGTMELPDMMMIAARLAARVETGEFPSLAALLASLTPADRCRLGEEYVDRTRVHRKTGRPLFIDKMPNNWAHVGLIRLVLPRARIIDARRHPMACGFSAWKQHFARGQTFSYDLAEVGRYYRDYVRYMAHVDAALPGTVTRVLHEAMVTDTEAEIRRLLDCCGLPFEPGCLSFWETRRAVRTASSEQVRRPIFTEGLDQWQGFARHLGPLAQALGDVASLYPAVPASLAPID